MQKYFFKMKDNFQKIEIYYKMKKKNKIEKYFFKMEDNFQIMKKYLKIKKYFYKM